MLHLNDIHFDLKKGETLGVVGRTGAGKTTLLKCLIREYDHFNGELKLGARYSRYNTSWCPFCHFIRAARSFLFSASIGENIAFGKADATYNEITQAAEIACIHNDILQFSEGYETVVGERGVSLSGGQNSESLLLVLY